MRVAYVCADPGVPVFGSKGCSLHAQEVLRVFCERGDTVELFTVRAGGLPAGFLRTVKVHPIKVQKTTSDSDRELALVEANESLQKLLETQESFDLVYERHALWSYAAMEFAQKGGIASVLEVNAPLIDEQGKYRQLFNRDLAQDSATRSVCAARLVTPVSAGMTSYLESLGVDPVRIHIVSNGVRHERFFPQTYRQHISDTFNVGFVGSLRPWHAVHDLIEAYDKLQEGSHVDNCELMLIGDGPLREPLAKQAANLPNSVQSQIRFAGAVPSVNIPSVLQAMDLAVAPYGPEGSCYFSPLKLFEYMAAGLPIVAARTGQMKEIINDGENGLLYTPGSSDDLAEKLDWLRCNPVIAAQMGRRAREVAISQHSWRSRVKTILSRLGVDQPATLSM